MSPDDPTAEIARLEKRIARERKARREAENIAEKATRNLYETVQSVEKSNRELEELKRLLQREVMELSTPVISVWDRILALPVIGTVDSDRAQRMTESLLQAILDREAETVIIDISGVAVMDTLVAQHLIKTVQAARLMGARTIISGIRPETAQTLVHLGVNWQETKTRNTLRDALRLAISLLEASDSSTGL